MKLTLNIVYTPGTIAMLSFMLHSLLAYSDCSFRLVSNACLPPEQRFLQKLAAGHPRLEFWALPAKRMWPHGQVLNYLHALNRDDHFAFLDSDIFATGEFLPELTAYLSSHNAVFTGAPVWSRSADQVFPQNFQMLSGPYNRTKTGAHIGGTYFAIYDNHMLSDLLSTGGVGFDEYRWEEIPDIWRMPLTSIGLNKQSYDTGKLVNALLIAQGHNLRYVDTPNLIHLGGTSFVPLAARPDQWWDKLPGISALRRWRAERGLYNRLAPVRIGRAEIQAEAAVRLDQRNVVRQYFWQLLQALHTHQPQSPIPATGDPEIQKRLGNAATALIHAHQQFAVDQSTRLPTRQEPTER